MVRSFFVRVREKITGVRRWQLGGGFSIDITLRDVEPQVFLVSHGVRIINLHRYAPEHVAHAIAPNGKWHSEAATGMRPATIWLGQCERGSEVLWAYLHEAGVLRAKETQNNARWHGYSGDLAQRVQNVLSSFGPGVAAERSAWEYATMIAWEIQQSFRVPVFEHVGVVGKVEELYAFMDKYLREYVDHLPETLRQIKDIYTHAEVEELIRRTIAANHFSSDKDPEKI